MRQKEIVTNRLQAEEFFALPEVDAQEELVQGDIVREPLPSFGHGAIAVRISWFLESWVRRRGPSRGPGRVVDHCGFVLARDPDTVRGPDVAFVSRDRLDAGTADGPFFEGAPDVAVEVLSPSNPAGEIEDKVRDYLRAGARQVWIVDPDRQTVTLHRPDRPPRTLHPGDTLDGGATLPGFAVPVEEIFQ